MFSAPTASNQTSLDLYEGKAIGHYLIIILLRDGETLLWMRYEIQSVVSLFIS